MSHEYTYTPVDIVLFIVSLNASRDTYLHATTRYLAATLVGRKYQCTRRGCFRNTADRLYLTLEHGRNGSASCAALRVVMLICRYFYAYAGLALTCARGT